MTALFATVNGVTQFLLLPCGTEGDVNDDKIAGVSPIGAMIDLEPMLHVALEGDGFSRDFAAGNTLRYADTAFGLRLEGQELSEEGKKTVLVSRFANGKGLVCRNILEWYKGEGLLTSRNELENTGEPVVVEALPSFNFSGVSPYGRQNLPQEVVLHKLVSNWSGEGKLYSVPTDRIAFEPSWSGLGLRIEKWTQTGTMPARGQLPFVAVEDRAHGVCWAAAIEAPASWTIETVFRNNNISVGGGRGDFLTAHWRKTLKRGEKICSDRAFLTVVKGDLEEACHRLLERFRRETVKKTEEDLPVLYNEYCYSWGNPSEEKLEKLLSAAEELGCRYFVVDDGWFKKAEGAARKVIGDWETDRTAFPRGIKAFSERVRSHGMSLGLWYEFENANTACEIYREHPEFFLTRAGRPISHRGVVFFDFRKAEAREYLREKVIRALRENGVGYIKVDYNENVGLGADGAESLGEGLRAHIEGVLDFYRELKRELPEVVLEICSSGGMRHEPAFLELADMVSFSDAHENPAGVNVACNLHRYIPPRKLQIWATIRDEYGLEEVRFTMAKAMLGRICLSGNLANKPREILEELGRAVSFYRTVSPIVKEGKTVCIWDGEIVSYLDPVGRTYLVRESGDGKEKLVYAYAIRAPKAEFAINTGDFRVKAAYNRPEDVRIEDGVLKFTAKDCALWGCVLLMERV